MSNFDPNSHDSVLTKVLGRLDLQDLRWADSNAEIRRSMDAFRIEVVGIRNAMTALEKFCWACGGGIVVISTALAIMAAAGWLTKH